MSWLLFLDESGHDHKATPYEVRGGVAIHASRLWPFIQAVQRLELDCFGCQLLLYKKELKGSTLLDKKRFRFANQDALMDDEARRKHCRAFLTKGLEKKSPVRLEFSAYGQACLAMATGIMQLLMGHGAALFAAVVPRSIQRPAAPQTHGYLRKDHVFLFERFFYLLEENKKFGLIVMDETDKTEDRRFVRQMEQYFTKTAPGQYRTTWIVPSPFFVASDMSYAVQAADVCIYCVNWGFRLDAIGMNAASRPEIAQQFGPWLNRLQFHGQGYRDGNAFESFGIVYVSDPYSAK
jgi:hypothetical protein